MNATMRRVGRIAGVGLGAAALLGLGYSARTWLRYGHASRDRGGDATLDRFMPEYEVVERHRIRISAPAGLTWAAVREMDLQRSPLVRAIFRGRELLMHAGHEAPMPREPLVAQVLQLGWGILAEEPGREIVFGAVTQPWDAEPTFRALPPSEFAAYDEPGWVKIVWNLAVDSTGATTSRFRSETRVVTTDADARKRFRRYWTMVEPGVRLIRRSSLRIVKDDAEHRYRDGTRLTEVSPHSAAEGER